LLLFTPDSTADSSAWLADWRCFCVKRTEFLRLVRPVFRVSSLLSSSSIL
jgi:hypothetical protein